MDRTNIIVERGKHRAFDFVWNMTIFSVVFERAVRAAANLPSPPSTAVHLAVLESVADEHHIVLPVQGVIEFVLRSEVPLSYEIGLRKRVDRGVPFNTTGALGLAQGVPSALFSLSCEPFLDWVRRRHSTDYGKWPPVANFCRVVRNAIVHGNQINITSAKAPTVQWRGLTYGPNSPSDNVYGRDLGAGDLTLLLLELDGKLDALGAPVSVP